MGAKQSAIVDKALSLIGKKDKSGVITPYRAAKMTGIALSTIYRAQKRMKKDQ